MFILLCVWTIFRLLGSPLAVLVTLLVNIWRLFLGSLWYLLLGPAVREGWRGWHLVSRVSRCPGNLADRDLAVAYPLPWYWGPVTHSMAAPLAVLEPQLGLTQPSGGALRVPVVVASRCQEPGLGVHLGLLVVRVELRRPQHHHVLPG